MISSIVSSWQNDTNLFFEVEGRFLYKFFEKAFIFIQITLK